MIIFRFFVFIRGIYGKYWQKYSALYLNDSSSLIIHNFQADFWVDFCDFMIFGAFYGVFLIFSQLRVGDKDNFCLVFGNN